MEIRYSKKAAKYINKQDAHNKRIIKVAIENLPNGDVKLIKNHQIITHRLRVGEYRILYYYIIDDIIYVEKIGVRGDVYKFM